MKTHWKILIAGLIVALVVLIYFSASALRTLRSTQTSETGQNQAPTPPKPAVADDSQPSPGLGAFVDRGVPAEDFAGRVQSSVARTSHLGETAAAEYRRRARLPKSTAPLEGDSDPIRSERTPSPAVGKGPGGAEPSLTVFCTDVSFETPDPVIVNAYFSRGHRRAPARFLAARFIHERLGEVASIELNDAGWQGDAAAGDLVYSGAFVPPPDRAEEFSGTYAVSVRGVSEDGEERAASAGFLYSAPDARPTGRFRDRLVDGSLVIDVEVEVSRAGRFHVEGSLFTLRGEGVAWAQYAAQLQPGRAWLPLTFYGLAIREKGLDGPYVLRSLALSTTTGMPNQKNRVLIDAYQTRAYRATQFTDQPYNDPDMIAAAERLEQAARERTP